MKQLIAIVFLVVSTVTSHFSITLQSDKICTTENIMKGKWTNENGDVIEIVDFKYVGFLDDPHQSQRFITGWYQPGSDDTEEIQLHGTFTSSGCCKTERLAKREEFSLEEDYVKIEKDE